MGRRRVTQQRAKDKHGKCGQIYGDLSTLNNQLILKVYFCHSWPQLHVADNAAQS